MESRRLLRILGALVALLLARRAVPAAAQPIFYEGFESGDFQKWAPCLLAIFPISPGSPSSWGGASPEHDIFNDIKAAYDDYPVPVLGTFTSVPDPPTRPLGRSSSGARSTPPPRKIAAISTTT